MGPMGKLTTDQSANPEIKEAQLRKPELGSPFPKGPKDPTIGFLSFG